jgi:hypothetical protein
LLAALGVSTAAGAAPLGPVQERAPQAQDVNKVQYWGYYDEDYRPYRRYYGYYAPRWYGYAPYATYYGPRYHRYYRNPFYRYDHGIRHERSPN